jgi:hypothetical protein
MSSTALPDPQLNPSDYPISAEEAVRRRIAYEARRRAYTEAWHAAPAATEKPVEDVA